MPPDEDNPRMGSQAWFNKLTAQFDAEAWELSVGAIVMTYDPETDSLYFTGPFPGPVEAFQWVESHDAVMNTGLAPDEQRYQISVHPMWAPDRPEEWGERPNHG